MSMPAIVQKTGKIYGQPADTVTRQTLKADYITRLKGTNVQKSVFYTTSGGFSCGNLA
ncbi:MAG: hypothetical protein H6Q26_954 [Bacteroidetes bacterium]|nr:hypothetical protein [Bacteroidota bacterium]